MASSGFEDLVIQQLGDLTERVSRMTEQIANLNLSLVTLTKNQEREELRRKTIGAPLESWDLEDSRHLKSLLDRERLRVERNEEVSATRTAQDQTITRWRDRVVLIGATLGLFAGLGLRLTDVLHSVGRWVGVVH